MVDPRHELRAVPRQHERLDSLELYSRLGVLTGRRIDDPAQIGDTIETIRASLESTTTQQSTVYGWMTQALFEGLVASLGTVRLLKTEDGGGMYTAGEAMKPPDFRIVTSTGERLLIEVKSFYQREPDSHYTIRDVDLDALRAYTRAMGGHRLMFAIYWVRWNLWTLTDASEFSPGRGVRSALPFERAAMRNELAQLGDYMIGTEGPLALTLHADRTKPRQVRSDGTEFSMTVAGVELSAAGRLIADAAEQRLAMYLLLYGRWEDHVETAHGPDGLESVSFIKSPDPSEGKGRVGTHGWLSSIYSTWFLHTTTNPDGHVVALRADVKPSMFAALVPEPSPASTLRLWRFYTRPDDQPAAGALTIRSDVVRPAES